MELEQILTDIGLPEREIKVYLATLELGESTVLPISQESGIKRTYCYDILESLREKGLVTYVERNGRRRYSAEPPEKIEQLLRSRLENFSRVLPELKGIYNRATTKPKVRYYDGLETVLPLYEKLKTVASYVAIAASDQLEKFMGPYLSELEKVVVERGAPARELIAYTQTPPSFAYSFQKPRHEVRMLPQGLTLTTDMLIYEDTLVLISYGDDIHAVTIQSSDLVDTHQKLFDLLWGSAIRISDADNKIAAPVSRTDSQ